MAQYTGLVTVDISSFTAFRNEVLGNGYDVDGLYGNQCVDMPKLLAGNAGRSAPYWLSLPDGYAREGWTEISNREYNASDYFTLVYNKADVKRGDLVILNATSSNPYGHIAFATHDWNADTTEAVLLGQNQVLPNPDYGHPNTETMVNVTSFLGGFRFTAWQTSGTITSKPVTKKFPWAIYARKLRYKR